MSTFVFDPQAYPEYAAIRDRTPDRPDVDRVYFGEGAFAQAADLNDAFSTEERKRKSIGDLIAADGDRLSGGDVIVDSSAGTVFVSAGTIYLLGSPRAVDEKTLAGVPMEGEVEIGVRVVTVPVTAEDDALFYGLVAGTESYGEEGAVRTTMSVSWAWEGDGGAGTFYKYVVLIDGQVIAQDAPPTLTGVQRQIAAYDYGAHGHYIVRGCTAQALDLNGDGERIFSIANGEANVNGFKVIRESDTRFEVPEEPDFGEVNLEPHTFTGVGTTKLRVRRPPIAAITVAIVTKERTVTLVKGASGSIDALPDDGVQAITLVKQGATTFVPTTDYVRTGDAVDWTPAGSEPATGSSYDVTYRYYDEVVPDTFDDTTVTLSGGVTGTDCFVAYDYKLPRFDRILMQSDGTFAYLKGESSPENPYPPVEPGDSLSLCVVKNTWFGKPVIDNNGARSVTFKRLNELEARLADTINLTLIEKLKSSAISRAPGATLGVFTDPFWDESYRDAGEAQDAAVFEGTLQIAIEPTIHAVRLSSVGMLNYSEQRVINQSTVTHCQKINPYQNFTPPGADLTVDPDEDFWTETEEVTLSDATRVFGSGNTTRVISTRTNVTTTTEKLRYLRQIPVSFRIEDFGAGETLAALTFDGINVNPGGLVADADGVITGSFNIPAKVAAGRKAIVATGGSGTRCSTTFIGQGKLETETTQQVTVLQRFQRFQRPFRESSGNNDGRDPQAQTFVQTVGRFISSIELRFCSIGNRGKPVDIEIVTTGDEGYPTREVVGAARVNMRTVVANTWHKVSLSMPVYQPANTYLAVVIKTDDPNHSISIARLGSFDATTQKWVTAQPYTAGDRFDGSNGLSWLLHPDSDISMRVNAALFSPASKTINIGTFAAVSISDIVVRASVILPEASTSVVFLVTMGTKTYRLLPDQTLELDAFYTGNVTVKAVLSGNSRVSPILSRDIMVVFGTMKASGSYVGTSFTMGNPVRLDIIFSGWLPNGSTVSVQADANDDTWVNATLVSSTAIDDGFTEYTYRIAAHAAPNGGRLKLALTGTPGARPALADLRAFTL